MPTAFIQLCRIGDIVSALPFMRALAKEEGQPVACYVHPTFAPIFDAVSYVKPVLRNTHHRDIAETVNQAKRDGYDQVIACQVDSNPTPAPAGCKNFIQEQWARAGYLDQFHDLPLVFDRRDSEEEMAVLRKFLPNRDGRPILAFCLSGHSSPFKQWKEFRSWIRGALGYKFQLLDLTSHDFQAEPNQVRLEKPQHLLPLIEAADVCLFTDSLPLHLTYAFCKPVFALQRDYISEPHRAMEWYQSEPRKHWIGRTLYGQTMQVDGRRRISAAIDDVKCWPMIYPPMSAEDSRRGIIHVVDHYVPEKEAECRRNLNALNKWEAIERVDENWRNVYFDASRHAKRSSRDIGDTRNLPYLKDILEYAVEKAGPDDVVCWTNADSVLVNDAAESIRRSMIGRDCCYSRRVQVEGDPPAARQRELSGLPVDGGTDLFCLRARWYREHAHEIPDFLIGCDAFDVCLRKLMDRYGGQEIKPPLVMHSRHSPFWSRRENLETNAGQKHNRWLYRQWCVENGIVPVI